MHHELHTHTHTYTHKATMVVSVTFVYVLSLYWFSIITIGLFKHTMGHLGFKGYQSTIDNERVKKEASQEPDTKKSK